MIRRTLVFFLVLSFCITIFSFVTDDKATPTKQKVVKTIIIDAGHGGTDAGAKGAYSYEKDICLAISKKLQEVLAKEMPDVKLLMTRETDTYPALHTRANFANNNMIPKKSVNKTHNDWHSEIVYLIIECK